jgi:hypothetical protein
MAGDWRPCEGARIYRGADGGKAGTLRRVQKRPLHTFLYKREHHFDSDIADPREADGCKSVSCGALGRWFTLIGQFATAKSKRKYPPSAATGWSVATSLPVSGFVPIYVNPMKYPKTRTNRLAHATKTAHNDVHQRDSTGILKNKPISRAPATQTPLTSAAMNG